MSRTTYITAAAILAALLTTMTGTANAQEIKAYLKKPNPDELIVMFLYGSDCPGERDSYRTIIEGELVRARIKEKTAMPRIGEPFLIVEIKCLTIKRGGIDTGFVYDIYAAFAMERSVSPFDLDFPRLNVDRDYTVTIVNNHGAYGYSMGGPNPRLDAAQNSRNALREEVANILTDFLKANQSP